MLRVRVAVSAERVDRLADALRRLGGVQRLVRLPVENDSGDYVLMADVTAIGADRAMAAVRELDGGVEDFVLVHEDVVATPQVHATSATQSDDFAWVEILGEARANSRPFGRYVALISAAAIIAALGVLTADGVLIVGAMAVSPDLLPICAACVGIVHGRPLLAGRALMTLLLGLFLVCVIAAALTGALRLTDVISDIDLSQSSVSGLAHLDYATGLVALAAGVAAIISFESRASAAVGVAISVTTIPASAYLGVAVGLGEVSKAWGALLVLAVNVVLLMLSGTLALKIQSVLAAQRQARAESR